MTQPLAPARPTPIAARRAAPRPKPRSWMRRVTLGQVAMGLAVAGLAAGAVYIWLLVATTNDLILSAV